MKLPNFKVLTEKSIMDIPYVNEAQRETDVGLLAEEQDNILTLNGIGFYKSYEVHFFDSRYNDECTIKIDIDDAIQHLAIKDGVDLVRFENGNIGFVAYCNGVENGFEILGDENKDE